MISLTTTLSVPKFLSSVLEISEIVVDPVEKGGTFGAVVGSSWDAKSVVCGPISVLWDEFRRFELRIIWVEWQIIFEEMFGRILVEFGK